MTTILWIVLAVPVYLLIVAMYGLMIGSCMWISQRVERLFITVGLFWRQGRLRRLAEDDPRRFVLLLHSYSRTEMIDSNFAYTNHHGDVSLTIYKSVIVLVGNSLGPMYPVVTLGSTYAVGRHSIRVWARPSTWRDLAIRLVHDCRTVVVIPEMTDGLLDEINILTQTHLLRKTVVLMPPNCGRQSHRWNEIRTKFLELGLKLPEYDPNGCLYLPNEDFSVRRRVPLFDSETIDRRRFQRAFDDIAAELDVEGRPLNQVLHEIRPFDVALPFWAVYRQTVSQMTWWPRSR